MEWRDPLLAAPVGERNRPGTPHRGLRVDVLDDGNSASDENLDPRIDPHSEQQVALRIGDA